MCLITSVERLERTITYTYFERFVGRKKKGGSPVRTWTKDIPEWIDWKDNINIGKRY
jgi:hypothetical protein